MSGAMKRFSAPPATYPDPARPPNDDDSEASLSDGSKKVKTAQSFESLFNSESLSDIVVDINDGEFIFHAHKMIVGLKSERLAALITSVATAPADNNNGEGGVDGGKPVLRLREAPECSAVFSRFLYFIYSGAVWLHRDYVVPLFRLSLKYGVGALASHCENYIAQMLNKCLHSDAASVSPGLSVSAVCGLCEDEGYREDTRKAAFAVLSRRFADLIRTERWITCAWSTVRDLLRCDECSCEENLILVAATDWMKRNRLQDKTQIQEILAAIRYPRLPRRVLYHLHTTASFKNFPLVQDLINAAIRYHCFKDVPEAQSEFLGLQYKARGRGRHMTRHTVCSGETLTRSNNNHNHNNNNNNNNNSNNNSSNNDIDNFSAQQQRSYCMESINPDSAALPTATSARRLRTGAEPDCLAEPDLLPDSRLMEQQRSRRSQSPNSPRRAATDHQHHHHHHHGAPRTPDPHHHPHLHHYPHNQHQHTACSIPDSLVSTFHPTTPAFPVATVQPRLQSQAHQTQDNVVEPRPATQDISIQIDPQHTHTQV